MKNWIKDNAILVVLYAIIAMLIILVIVIRFTTKEDNVEVTEEHTAHVYLANKDTDLEANYVVGLDKVLKSHPNLTYKFYGELNESVDSYLKEQDYSGREVILTSQGDTGTIITMRFTISDSDEFLLVEYEQGVGTFNISIK